MKKPNKGQEPVREFPYYKLQYWEVRISAWMDIQKSFKSRDDLLSHATSALNSDTRIRIVIVEDYGQRRILEDCGTVGDRYRGIRTKK